MSSMFDVMARLTGSSEGMVRAFAEGSAAAEGFSKKAESANAKVLASSKTASEGMAAGFSKFGAVSGLVLAGVGLISIDMAAKFQKSTELLVTAGGEAQSNLGMVRDGIKAIAVSTGTSTEQLSEGMYVMEKAGYRGADGLHVLRAAAEGAAAENVDLATMTQAVTDIMLDYGLKTGAAVPVVNELVAASGAAKTTMQDFAGSMAAVIPIGSAVGISFTQLGGAIATMTQHGMSAQQAADNLSNFISSLAKPSLVAQKAMQQMGLSAQDVSANLGKRGLSGTLEILSNAIKDHMGPDGLVMQGTMKLNAQATKDLNDAIKVMPPSLKTLSKGLMDGTISQKEYTSDTKKMNAQSQAMGQAFDSLYKKTSGFSDNLKQGATTALTFNGEMQLMTGGMTGLKVSTMLLMNDMSQFNSNIKLIGDAAKLSGTHISTWADTQSTLTVQMAQSKEMLSTLMITIGSSLIPVANQALKAITDLVNGFKDGNPVLLTLAAILGGVVAAALATFIIRMTLAGVTAVKAWIEMGAMAAAGAIQFVQGFAGITGGAHQAETAMSKMGAATKGAIGSGVGAGIALAALGASLAIIAMNTDKASVSTDKMDSALKEMAMGSQSGKTQMDNLFKNWNTVFGQATSDVTDLSSGVKEFTHQDFQTAGLAAFSGSIGKLFGGSGTDMQQFADRLKGIGDEMGKMVGSGDLATASADFGKLSAEFIKNGKSAQDALDTLPGYKQSLIDLAATYGHNIAGQELLDFAMGKVPQYMVDAADATKFYSDATGAVHPVTTDMQKALDAVGVSIKGEILDLGKLTDAMVSAGLMTLDARDAQFKFSAATRDAKNAVDDYRKSNGKLGPALNKTATDFNTTTEAGGKANAAFEGITRAGYAQVQSLTKVHASHGQVQAAMTATYNSMVTTAEGFGMSKTAAEKLTRSVLGIPPGVSVSSWMSDYAKRMAEQTKQALQQIPPVVNSTIQVSIDANAAIADYNNVVAQTRGHKGKAAYATGGLVAFATGGLVGGYPSGGYLSGPGTGTSDSMLAMVSNGEYMVKAAAVAKYGVGFMDGINDGTWAPAAGSPAGAASWSPGHAGGAAGAAPSLDGVTIVLDIPELGGRLEAKIRSASQDAATEAIHQVTRAALNSAGIRG